MKFENESPAAAPIRQAKISAKDDPKKTANGLSLLPLIATVANWVLSPSSARKMVVKVEIIMGSKIFMCYTILRLRLWINSHKPIIIISPPAVQSNTF